jgi:hypothetical protein
MAENYSCFIQRADNAPVPPVTPIPTAPPSMVMPERQSTSNSPLRIIGIALAVLFLGILGSCAICVMLPSSPQQPLSPQESQPTAEQQYFTAVANQCSRLAPEMTSLGNLLSAPQLGNTVWNNQVANRLANIQAIYREATGLSSPASVVQIHSKYIQALAHYNTMCSLLARGIDTLDVSLINQANAEAELGITAINEATDLINNYNATH